MSFTRAGETIVRITFLSSLFIEENLRLIEIIPVKVLNGLLSLFMLIWVYVHEQRIFQIVISLLLILYD
jgi:hypothetical protein